MIQPVDRLGQEQRGLPGGVDEPQQLDLGGGKGFAQRFEHARVVGEGQHVGVIQGVGRKRHGEDLHHAHGPHHVAAEQAVQIYGAACRAHQTVASLDQGFRGEDVDFEQCRVELVGQVLGGTPAEVLGGKVVAQTQGFRRLGRGRGEQPRHQGRRQGDGQGGGRRGGQG
ncbi:hypothetical protein TW86_09940 [Halomonas sp. S2151]|nr:hypothetical protein TW86_09940 [Halomonas sp. S2151]